jgi:hypothetical protein
MFLTKAKNLPMIENVQKVRQSNKIMGGPMPLRERGCAIELASLSVCPSFWRQTNG